MRDKFARDRLDGVEIRIQELRLEFLRSVTGMKNEVGILNRRLDALAAEMDLQWAEPKNEPGWEKIRGNE